MVVFETEPGTDGNHEPSLPAHASYSSLRAWLTCQEKWWLTKVGRRPGRPGYALVGGSAVHLVSEWWEAEYCQIEAAA